ncbi:MAG TPA: type II toxin-antitoxin system RelE/ParE family toxin [Vicinamibacteria bacterium]|nr:type II toxin-antitoxin system RelE/ParE family toxin [Vicinamibacteria bacterium]
MGRLLSRPMASGPADSLPIRRTPRPQVSSNPESGIPKEMIDADKLGELPASFANSMICVLLEACSGKRKGQFSVRINDQYRVCFRWTDEGADTVKTVDYHKGYDAPVRPSKRDAAPGRPRARQAGL